ncbi:dTDP-4-dehydrorhamnose reductase [Ensifer sesbaniae]|uniref:dTDP-4-dehydrorhamnose reductase n=1 Tax=Ensifer sesbaniae TaxID=1214071 RepID=UPI001FE79C2E|nr:dTDP-4-dehydrorhamnose reductase [Ensifer sesbaniae]NRQ18230.1 dTDP-4-dehydrorhamnose reductase [Ensifer sesbaniae]
MRKVIVTGCEGQVARSIIERAMHLRELEFVTIGRPELDLADPAGLTKKLVDLKPNAIVSAAAYTAVDKAEGDVKTAFRINGEAPREIAKAASVLRIPLVHLSTDYVFDGSKSDPYSETDLTCPVSVYGASKLLGEQAIADTTDNYAVLRTAWVYSPFSRNFLLTMLRLAQDREEISVVDDQHGNPTSALDIADGVIAVVQNLIASDASELRGTFHMTASGTASWADFASYIFAVANDLGIPTSRVRRISTNEYPTPARRPANSRLSCERLADIHGVRLPDWQASTMAVIKRLATHGCA